MPRFLFTLAIIVNSSSGNFLVAPKTKSFKTCNSKLQILKYWSLTLSLSVLLTITSFLTSHMFIHPKCPLFLSASHFGTPFNSWISFMDQCNCFLFWGTFLGHPSPTIYYTHVCLSRNRRHLRVKLLWSSLLHIPIAYLTGKSCEYLLNG